MGGSSKQVIGHKYFTNLLLFVGNPIEKMLGINFDKRGWINPFVDEDGNDLAQGYIDKPYLYGENEGGVAGTVHVQYGTDDQKVLPFYKEYMESKGLQASAYPFQSYLGFTGFDSTESSSFYVGNSGYMKEMLLWPKRIHVRNDGSFQWYDAKSEIGLYDDRFVNNDQKFSIKLDHYQSSSNDSQDIDYRYYDYYITPPLGNAETFPLQGYGGGSSISPLEDYEGAFGNQWIFHEANYVKYAELTVSLAAINHSFFIDGVVSEYLGNPDSPLSGAHIELIETREPNTKIYKIKMLFISKIKVDCKLKGRVANKVGSYYASFGISGFFRYATKSDTIGFGQDINPIHKIREILTDDTAMNKPESSVNDDNFIKAANRIYDEGLGVSWSITEKSCIDAINELCYHIEAGIRINRQTGLYEIVLFRDDWFEEDEIHIIPENKIKSMQYEITNADEVINQVNVNFYDRENIKNSSFSISENGLIQTLGRVNAETLDFPYFMNMRNANIVANWKLKQLSTGAFKGSFTTGWREARKWNRYDLIKLPWSKRWTGTILVRIMSINLGGPTNNEVTIEFIEVVPATGMMNTTIVADDPIDKPLPPQPIHYEPFEMPYYLAVMAIGQRQVDEELAYESDFGLVGVVAEQPQSNSLHAVMMTNNYDEWVRAGSIQYSLTADSDQIISKTSTSFIVKNWKKISNVPVGTLIQCGKEWLTGFVEWMVFQGIDPNTGVISVKRGALDTQPQDWDSGLKLYFCGTDVAYDTTEYLAGEKVLVSALTTTPSGVLELKGSHSVEMKARAIRPYPPANVKINGEYWPAEIETDLIITWVDRNRVQQTGGEVIGWFEGGVTIEPNTQTHLILSQLDENDNELATANANVTGATSYTIPISIMQASTRTVRVTLKTVRNGYECLNPFVHTVELSQFFSAPYDLTVEFKHD